ncbi:MAG: hypothetical protein HY741_00840 [Chloroflexi bacterium]|nr:hypothetical protein [Chloroflexota bacterium]
MVTIEAEIDELGNVKIHSPVMIEGPRRALVVVLDEPPTPLEELEAEKIDESDLEAEDRVWAETMKRHADKFAALRANS